MNNMQRLTPVQKARQRANRIERAASKKRQRRERAVEVWMSSMQRHPLNTHHAHHGHTSNRVLYSQLVKSVHRNVAYLRMKRAVIGHTQRSQQTHILTTLLDVMVSMARGLRPAPRATAVGA